MNECKICGDVCLYYLPHDVCNKCQELNDKKHTSPPSDVVEAARQTTKRFGELDGEAWKDVQAVCEWVLSHEAIDK